MCRKYLSIYVLNIIPSKDTSKSLLKRQLCMPGAYSGICPGGLKFFLSFQGGSAPVGPENPLKPIDFTGPWGLAPLAPPLNTPLLHAILYSTHPNIKPKIFHLSIYKFGLSVCLSVCLFVSNKRQNGWTDRAQIFCGTSRDPREGLWMIKILKICV